MTDYTQISAQISAHAKKRLDIYAAESGLKKGRIIEEALTKHLDALEEIPPEYIIESHIVVSAEDWEWMVQEMETPSPPTPALIELMQRGSTDQD